jgi:imidazole glycerol-phosphate synthase subunit HisH
VPGKLTVVDYGMGNLFSIRRAALYIGVQAEITADPERISQSDRLILPGVGAFGEGMAGLNANGLREAISDFIRKGNPFLGICLGMQLLMTEGHEFGFHEGLKLIPGKAVKFDSPSLGEVSFKIPHVGWNRIDRPSCASGGSNAWMGTVLHTTEPGTCFYFVHSFIVSPDKQENTLAETYYGKNRFCSVVFKDNVCGCQFHPEKSGKAGLALLHRFLQL